MHVRVGVLSEVGELTLTSVQFDPVSGDSRIVLGNAVLDSIDQNKPFSIESVPQAELEQRNFESAEIFYERFGQFSCMTTAHLAACQFFRMRS